MEISRTYYTNDWRSWPLPVTKTITKQNIFENI